MVQEGTIRKRWSSAFRTWRSSAPGRRLPQTGSGCAADVTATTKVRRCRAKILTGYASRERPCPGVAASRKVEEISTASSRCHDPHGNVKISVEYYVTADASIAIPAKQSRDSPFRLWTWKIPVSFRPQRANPNSGESSRGSVCPINPTQGCVGCHMPPIRSEPSHATFADHYIRVHPKSRSMQERGVCSIVKVALFCGRLGGRR